MPLSKTWHFNIAWDRDSTIVAVEKEIRRNTRQVPLSMTAASRAPRLRHCPLNPEQLCQRSVKDGIRPGSDLHHHLFIVAEIPCQHRNLLRYNPIHNGVDITLQNGLLVIDDEHAKAYVTHSLPTAVECHHDFAEMHTAALRKMLLSVTTDTK